MEALGKPHAGIVPDLLAEWMGVRAGEQARHEARHDDDRRLLLWAHCR